MIKESQVFVPAPKDDKLTIIGWLRKIFLYKNQDYLDDPEDDESRKKYEEAIDLLRKYGKIKGSEIYEWEEKTPLRKTARILNKVIEEMYE